jgi:hypothetical protein
MSYDSIFVKTGVSRQSELIRLATQIAPAAARSMLDGQFAKQQS